MDPIELLIQKIGNAQVSIEHTRAEVRGIDKSHSVSGSTVEYDRVADAGYVVSCRSKEDSVRYYARCGEQNRESYQK